MAQGAKPGPHVRSGLWSFHQDLGLGLNSSVAPVSSLPDWQLGLIQVETPIFGRTYACNTIQTAINPRKIKNSIQNLQIGARPIIRYEPQENPLPDGAAQPLPPPPAMENAERTRSDSLPPHFGQTISAGELSETSSSKISPHFPHLYSYNGTRVLLSQMSKTAFYTTAAFNR